MHRKPMGKLLAAAAILALTAPTALHSAALAQQAKSPEAVVLLTSDAGQAYATIGAISVETHQTSMFPKVSREQQLETELRRQAAAMGADAVIHVKYDYSSALTSKKGNKALGVAVKFTSVAAAPAIAAPPVATPAPAPTIVATAPAIPQPAAPVIATPAPAAAPTVSTPAPAPTQVAAPVAAPAAPAPVIHATTPEMVMLSEATIPGRSYRKLSTVTVTTHQTSMFPKVPAMTVLQNALKAEALKAGADAVIEVRYTMNNPMLSKKGNTATGVAVRFD